MCQSTPARPTPLPRRKAAILALVCVSNATSLTVIFPFLTFFVRFIGVSEHRVGFYAGALGSAFSLGSFCSSTAWGRLSDRVGRKPVMATGLFLTTGCSLWFGFTTLSLIHI